MKRIRVGRSFGVVALVSSLLACKLGSDEGKASVTCEGKTEQIDCDVKHEAGADTLTVCWDLRFDCANGTVSEAKNVCQSVTKGGTARRAIPIAQLSNYDKCDKALGTQVQNLKISEGAMPPQQGVAPSPGTEAPPAKDEGTGSAEPKAGAAEEGRPAREASAKGMCERGLLDCKCKEQTVDECLAEAKKELGDTVLPKELWECFVALDCKAICSEDAKAVENCAKPIVAKLQAQGKLSKKAASQPGATGSPAAAAEQKEHDTAMFILNQMDDNCPAGQQAVNGVCMDM